MIDADDPAAAFAAYRDDLAVEPAGKALLAQYIDACMKLTFSEVEVVRDRS